MIIVWGSKQTILSVKARGGNAVLARVASKMGREI